ncbi:trypsin-like peptidase domain-containing protein [Streptomyces sp. TRM68367]|uniref:trypsin-like serine peptidase n=1 Tax=Streptomyces sp. TRM68367 TaxID=2758415 RepID=UPI00165C9ED3|nr:trypsin-like serine protease [Streptomyces sp. TRM68367]MBC9731380.1 trypsin-like peptidase domain-containing protein [Streptomyces sp. TRM68367]
MRLPRFAAAAAATLAIAVWPTAAHAATATSTSTEQGVDSHEAERTDAQIRAYWTPERMADALRHPVDAPTAPASTTTAPRHEASVPSRPMTASARGILPKTTTSYSTTAATATVSVSQEVPYSTNPAYSLVGKLFFDQPDGSHHVCSASSIVSSNKNTIWTAGHCVHLGNGSGDAGWSQNVYYVPGYRDGNGPYGAWTSAHMYAPSTWTADGDLKESDMAAIVLNSHPTYGSLQTALGGALGYTFADNATDYSDVYTMGYPQDGYQRTDLNGERMMYCEGDSVDASYFNPFDDRLKVDCDMGHGASGGPLVYGTSAGNPQIVGAVSHHESDSNGNRLSDDLFSSEHGANAAAVIRAANAA